MFSSKMRLSLRPSGTSPRTMRCARPSTIAVLPTPGSPMRTGLFFVRRERTWMTRRISSSRPIHAADLLVAADDRIDLAFARELGEVAPVLLERLVLALRVSVGDALVAAHVLEGAEHALVRDAETLQRLTGVPVVGGHREQQVLGGDVLVAERLRFFLRALEDAAEPRGCADLHVAGHLRLALELGAERAAQLCRLHAERGEDAGHDTALLLQQRRGEMLDVDLAVSVVPRALLRADDGFLRFLGELVRIDHFEFTYLGLCSSLCRFVFAPGRISIRRFA